MVFFSLETVACFITQGSVDNGQCGNTGTTAAFLSIFPLILIMLSIFSKIAPKSVQIEMSWKLSQIATLKGLKWWQKPMGGPYAVFMISSLYLLGSLGVEGEESASVGLAGSVGLGCLIFIVAVQCGAIDRAMKEYERQHMQPSDLELSHNT